jgi:YVTN family beta-propeller protein
VTVSFALLVSSVTAGAQPDAYVTNVISNTVSVIDTATDTVIKTIAVGDGPEGVAVNPDNTRAYVANSNADTGEGNPDTVSVISVASNTVVDTITVGDNPQGVAVHPSGFWVYVVNNSDSTVSVIDAADNTVDGTITVAKGALRAVVSPGGHRLYVANAGDNNVSVVNTVSNLDLMQIPVGTSPAGLDVTPNRSRLYGANTNDPLPGGGVGTVSVIDTASNTVVKTIEVEGAEAVAVTPDGDHVYVTQRFPSGVTVIDTATDTVSDTVTVGQIPRGLAVTPDGSRVYVANSVSSTVSVIDTATNTEVDTVVVNSRPIAFGKFISPLTLGFTDRFESGDVSVWSDAVGWYAGYVKVKGTAAYSRDFGLEVTVPGVCTAPVDRVITSPPVIEGLFLGCNSITASGVQVGGTGATFAAGSNIALGQDFSTASGSPFTAAIDPALLNGLGYVIWDSASALDGYLASFLLRLDDLSLAEGDLVELFNGYSSNGAVQFKTILKYNAATMEKRLVSSVRQDNGTFVETPFGKEIQLPDDWNAIGVEWKTGSGTGSLSVWVSGGTEVSLTGVDNDAQRLDEVRLGYVGGTVSTTSGTMDLDDFWSQQ